MSRAEIDQIPEPCRQRLLKYAYRCGIDDLSILAVDDSGYMNHSASLNTAEDFTVDTRGLTEASRDIKAEEELTMDYFEFDLDAAEKLGVNALKA